MSTIGQRIKNCRLASGMSADEIAARLGKNRATVYRYESDEIENVSVQVIGLLAEIFGVSPAYLMGWEEKAVPDNEDGQIKAIDLEIADLILNLSPEKKQEALHYLKYLASREEI